MRGYYGAPKRDSAFQKIVEVIVVRCFRVQKTFDDEAKHGSVY